MKYTYVSPETEVVRFNLETAFLASDVTDALGTDLGTPVIIGGDFDSLF